jgi:hypothetical protein
MYYLLYKMSDENFFNKLKNLINSFIWDLPFENYHKYYKTGIIQKMSNQERIDFFFKRHKDLNKKNYIKRLIILRPNILDDEDKIYFLENKQQADRLKTIYFVGFVLNNFFCGYLLLVKRSLGTIQYIAFSNIMFLFLFPVTKMKQEKLNEEIYLKYRHLIDEDKTYDMFAKASNID